MKALRFGELPIISVSILHTAWGILLLFSSAPSFTTPVSQIANVVSDHRLQGSLLIISSVLSFISVFRSYRFWMLIPQQIMIGASLIGPILAVLGGHYADLEIRSRVFIFADQLPVMTLSLMYTIGLMLRQRRFRNG